jgi:hypothetical protein
VIPRFSRRENPFGRSSVRRGRIEMVALKGSSNTCRRTGTCALASGTCSNPMSSLPKTVNDFAASPGEWVSRLA